jgi:lysophospholipase L1-like esterase
VARFENKVNRSSPELVEARNTVSVRLLLGVALSLASICPYLCAQAASPGSPGDGTGLGVSQFPCNYVSPLPIDLQDYINAMMESLRTGAPLPVPKAEGAAAYVNWEQSNRLQDFGANCKYLAANEKLSPPTRHRIVFFGDSLTEYWGVEDPTFFTNDVINRGVSGQTSAQMLVRFRQDVLDLHPSTLHLVAGGNDLAGNTGPTSLARVEGNIMSMVEQAQAHHIRVVLGSLLPATVLPWRPSVKIGPTIIEFNEWLKQYASERGITFIDYYSPLVDDSRAFRKELTVDGVHPNRAGYAVMEPLAKKALQ